MENKHQNPIETLSEIRKLMERSSRFISLSGLSGVFAGIYAIIGAGVAYWYLRINIETRVNYHDIINSDGIKTDFLLFFIIDAGLVLLLAIVTGIVLTTRSAKKNNQSIWDKSAKRLVINMFIPLAVGGIFCLAILNLKLYGLIAPILLIFYGLALIHASKYTLGDIRYLGICEVVLGLIASFFIGYGLLCWTIGFGILHIIYGILMYNKYEK
jgi:predicted lysophospholipase L1 biosynthesis ABC-type transport system permease subunit